jgi:hypothetical protein
MATATEEGNDAKGLPSAYSELYELAIMLGADEHPLLKLGIGAPMGYVPAQGASDDSAGSD